MPDAAAGDRVRGGRPDPAVAEEIQLPDVHALQRREERAGIAAVARHHQTALGVDGLDRESLLFQECPDLVEDQIGTVGDEAGEKVLADYGVSSIPATFLIGPDGRVIARGMRGEGIKDAGVSAQVHLAQFNAAYRLFLNLLEAPRA